MITIHVVSVGGQPPAQPLAAEFDETGGTIGRTSNNDLVLPDPHVSRLHARILFANGRYVVAEQGKASILLNGQPIGKEAQAPLSDGDQMLICGFLLKVTESAQQKAGMDGVQGGEFVPQGPAGLSGPAADVPPPPSGAPGFIPQNFDPFAEQSVVNASPSAKAKPDLLGDLDLPLGPGTGNDNSLDAMFGLSSGASASSDLFGPGSPLGEPLNPKGGDRAGSLLSGLDKPSGPVRAPQRNDTPELHGSFKPPAASAEGAARASSPASRAAPRVPAAPVSSRQAERADLGSKPATAAPASQDALLNAFLRGLGVDSDVQVKQLTPEMLTLIGVLLREAVQGTLDLLRARAQTKTAVHADVTLIAGRNNNPLKFSPDVATALSHMLAPSRGFMAPHEAMRDAYNDLRSHSLGVMAGMRAALAGVLQRFDPTILETRLNEKSILDGLLPMNRQAKLWNLFVDRYSALSQEAEEDFHALFGKAFLSAYEKQVSRVRGKGEGR